MIEWSEIDWTATYKAVERLHYRLRRQPFTRMGPRALETRIMKEIQCELVPPTASGRLYPKYDLEADILSFESEQEKEWPLGIDIDGNVVFDLDENFRVGMIDLLIGRAGWKKQTLKWPAVLMDHDLVLTQESVVEKSFSLQVSVCFDPHAKIVRVDFPSLELGRHISLSDFAIASLSSSGGLANLWARDVF